MMYPQQNDARDRITQALMEVANPSPRLQMPDMEHRWRRCMSSSRIALRAFSASSAARPLCVRKLSH